LLTTDNVYLVVCKISFSLILESSSGRKINSGGQWSGGPTTHKTKKNYRPK